MKTLRLFLGFVAMLLLSACSDDDDNAGAALEGTWKLTHVQGGIAGVDQQFEPGAITWTFNNDGTVDVVNGQIPETGHEFFETGTYNYVVTEANSAGCEGTMQIDNVVFGCMSVGSHTLKFDDQSADGFLVTLKR